MVTRPMTRADVHEVTRLAQEAGCSSFDIATRFDVLRAAPDDGLFVAERGGAVVGFAHVHAVRPLHAPAYALTIALVVALAARRQGVARELLAACRAWAAACGCADLRLP